MVQYVICYSSSGPDHAENPNRMEIAQMKLFSPRKDLPLKEIQIEKTTTVIV
jgi:hypothetical protein